MILVTVTPSPPPAQPWEVDLECSYSDAIVAQLKAMPGLRWLPKERLWRGPVEAVRMVTATLERASVAKCEWRSEQVHTARLPLTEGGDGLRAYQLDAVAWLRWQLLFAGGALLADEMGLGKSCSAITALDAACPDGRILIVCPAVVVSHWESQITRWGTRFGIELSLDPDDFEPAATRAELRRLSRRWHVMSYEAARKAAADINAAAIVLDEIHYLSNPKSARSEAIADWCDTHPEAKRVGLSGTPMTARPQDLWHPLHLLHPGRWGNKWQFEKRYCGGRYEEIKIGAGTKSIWVADTPTNTSELAARLQSVMLRRTKAEVAAELPALTRQVIDVELTTKMRRGIGLAANAAIDGDNGRWKIRAQLEAGETHKIEAAAALAREIISAGGKPLLLTLRRETAHRLGGMLMAPVVTGDVDATDRQATLEAPGAPAGVATLASVTTGIDLVSFDSVIFVGLDWVPSNMLQGEARIHRIGQARSVTAYYLIGLGTVDEMIREKVIDRLDLFATLTGGDATGGMATSLRGGTEEELLQSLAAEILAGAA